MGQPGGRCGREGRGGSGEGVIKRALGTKYENAPRVLGGLLKKRKTVFLIAELMAGGGTQARARDRRKKKRMASTDRRSNPRIAGEPGSGVMTRNSWEAA